MKLKLGHWEYFLLSVYHLLYCQPKPQLFSQKYHTCFGQQPKSEQFFLFLRFVVVSVKAFYHQLYVTERQNNLAFP